MYVVHWFYVVTSVKMAVRKSNALGPSEYSCISFIDFIDQKRHVEVWWPHIHDAELFFCLLIP